MNQGHNALIANMFLMQTNEQLSSKYKTMMGSLWNVMTTGDSVWAERCEDAEQGYQEFLSAVSMKEQTDSLLRLPDNELAAQSRRQLEILNNEMLELRTSEELRRNIRALWNELHYTISTYRAEVEQIKLSENEVLRLLTTLTDESKRKKVWLEAMKLGQEVAPKLIKLVELRNRVARQNGYDNYYDLKMASQEMQPETIERLIRDLRQGLDSSYKLVKAELDETISDRYQIPVSQIRSWHYNHPFLQSYRSEEDLYDSWEWKEELPQLVEWFAEQGFDLTNVMAQADLTAKTGKSQANCCLHIDRAGDIRISCNLASGAEALSVLMHELGHACYELGIQEGLPFILRQPAHPCLSEAVALLLERLALNNGWLQSWRKEPAFIDRTPALHRYFYRNMLVKLYWTMTLVQFEQKLYENPRQQLNRLWWDTVEEVQGIRRPDEWDAPYWAAKAHLSTLPVYYHNYLLGEVTATQIEYVLGEKFGLWHNKSAINHLREKLCAPGMSKRWDEAFHELCGEDLKAQYMVDQLCAMTDIYSPVR